MAKRGRKPKSDRKGYFYEKEEEAFVKFLRSDDKEEKNSIFNRDLLPAFTKMVESIIRRYKLFPPDEEYEETFNDTISFLLTKIHCFKPESGYKAYSYCGTICKNYLIFKINQYVKNRNKNDSYENMENEICNDLRFSYEHNSDRINALNDLILDTVFEIEDMIGNREKYRLTDTEVLVGQALVNLMSNWEDYFAKIGSNKFNKSSILLSLREMTSLTTNEIRNGMKKYKVIYQALKRQMMEK